MTLAWVTGNSGAGKSTVCEFLKSAGQPAFDADREGYNRWVDRAGGNAVTDPPYPVPAGWLCPFSLIMALAGDRCRGLTFLLRLDASGAVRRESAGGVSCLLSSARISNHVVGPALHLDRIAETSRQDVSEKMAVRRWGG